MSQVEHEELVLPSCALGLGVDPAQQVDIALGIEDDHDLAPAYVLRKEYFGQAGFPDAGCAQDQHMAYAVANVHPVTRLRWLDSVNGRIAADSRLLSPPRAQGYSEPISEAGFQHVPVFGESRFV